MRREESNAGRVLSVDALRGFAIVCIIGADGIARALSEVGARHDHWAAAAARVAGTQFTHARWEGFHFYDLVFPLFLFTVGLSIPLSLGAARASGRRGEALPRVVRRSVLLFALGIVYNIGWNWPVPEIRIAGVLQRIAICYFVAAVCFLYLPARWIMIVTGAVVVGYALVLANVPVAGSRFGSYDEAMNLAIRIDQLWLPGEKHFGDWDPEGLLTTVPAVASCLIGVVAGLLLVGGGSIRAAVRPVVWGGAGFVLLGGGVALAAEVPVIKNLWTASYVLVAGGLSLILFAAAYGVIDLAGRVGLAWAAIWVGANAILFYVLDRFVDFDGLALRGLSAGGLADGVDAVMGPGASGLAANVAGLGLAMALARALYVRRLFLRL